MGDFDLLGVSWHFADSKRFIMRHFSYSVNPIFNGSLVPWHSLSYGILMRTSFLWPLASKYRSNLLTLLVRSLFTFWASGPTISENVTSKHSSPRCSSGFAGSSEVHNPFRRLSKKLKQSSVFWEASFMLLDCFNGVFLASCLPCQTTFVLFPC